MTTDRMLEILEHNMTMDPIITIVRDRTAPNDVTICICGKHDCSASDASLVGALMLAAETVERLERDSKIKT